MKKSAAVSPRSKLGKRIKGCAPALVTGTVLSIDPSIGSSSSLPGWAVFQKGKKTASGVLQVPRRGEVWIRLIALGVAISDLIDTHGPIDVMVYEDVRGRSVHSSLHKALGAILSRKGPKDYFPFRPVDWTQRASKSYSKSDENDAIEMGQVAIELAKQELNRT